MNPAVHYTVRDLRGKPLKDLYEEVEQNRISVKEALGYRWDNNNNYVTDIYSRPTLKFSVHYDGSGISFWDASGCASIGNFSEVPEDLEDIARRVGDGKLRCNSCGAWHPKDEMKRYSFAGVVCQGCYDPKRHLPPDTK